MARYGVKPFLAMLAVLSFGTAAAAEDDVLVTVVPEGWPKIQDADREKTRIIDFAPPGQSGQSWTHLATVYVRRDAENVAPRKMADFFLKEFKSACDDVKSSRLQKPGGGKEPDNVFSFILWCGENELTGRGEVMISRVLRGKSTIFVVQRSWAVAPFDPDKVNPVDKRELGANFQVISSSVLCKAARDPSGRIVPDALCVGPPERGRFGRRLVVPGARKGG